MKIAFVQPPNTQRSGDWERMRVSRPPINLALLAACVREYDYEPIIYDLDWFGGNVEDMARLILSEEPDFVGFTCLTPRLEITLSIVAKIKEINPKVKTIIGGAHVNGFKGQPFHYRNIDYAIYYETRTIC